MTDASDDDVLGPIDYVLIEFTRGQVVGESAAELLHLVDTGIIRLYDVAILAKDADGAFSKVELTDVNEAAIGGLITFAGAQSGLLGDEDYAAAAEAMEPDTVAALLVYENRWAERFVSAARREGGRMIATARIPAQDVLDALDALERA